MKERLLKLIQAVQTSGEWKEGLQSHYRSNEQLAKSLIESEQVIVLPCKLESKIYHLDLEIPEGAPSCSECYYNCSGFGEFWCDKNYIGWPCFEDKLRHPEDVCPNYEIIVREETFALGFWARMEKWFNKTWFLNEEDAYKAVKEYKNEASLSEDPS